MNNKADLSARKIVVMILIVIVLAFLVPSNLKLKDLVGSGISSFEEGACEADPNSFILKTPYNCKLNDNCNSDEQKAWDLQVELWNKQLENKNCPALEKESDVEKKCSCVQEKIWKVLKEKEDPEEIKIFETGNKNFKETAVKTSLITGAEVIKLLRNKEDLLNKFSKEKNIEIGKLKTFLKVESSGKPFNGDYPTLRFECVRYNKRVIEENKVSCDTSKYKYGGSKDTGQEAFLKAIEKDRNQALLQTSYGVGQIMGFNYQAAGYNSVEDYYKAMFNEEKQIEAFLNFILSKNLLKTELQKGDTNWETVASVYNGKDYKTNNYGNKLEQAYQLYS